MHNLKIDLGNCVKVFAKNSTCTKCEEICPHNAISYLENIPNVNDQCIDCGGCIGVCPTEAISLKTFDTLEFIFSFLENNESLISCKKNIPCLATLSVENLISLALLSKETILDLGHCATCPITDPLLNQINTNILEANSFLKEIQSDKQIISKDVHYEEPIKEDEPDRREFLKRFSVKGAIKSKVEFEQIIEDSQQELSQEDTANIRKKIIPNKRKLLFMALKRVNKPNVYHSFMHEELSFISQKNINDDCDNCSMCYRICPTGALQSNKRQTKIDFDPLMCVKCSLCHDVCAPNAITLIPYNTKELFEPKITELINFKVIRCEECANFFTYFGGEKLCQRCKIEEEEAKSLWGIQ